MPKIKFWLIIFITMFFSFILLISSGIDYSDHGYSYYTINWTPNTIIKVIVLVILLVFNILSAIKLAKTYKEQYK